MEEIDYKKTFTKLAGLGRIAHTATTRSQKILEDRALKKNTNLPFIIPNRFSSLAELQNKLNSLQDKSPADIKKDIEEYNKDREMFKKIVNLKFPPQDKIIVDAISFIGIMLENEDSVLQTLAKKHLNKKEIKAASVKLNDPNKIRDIAKSCNLHGIQNFIK